MKMEMKIIDEENVLQIVEFYEYLNYIDDRGILKIQEYFDKKLEDDAFCIKNTLVHINVCLQLAQDRFPEYRELFEQYQRRISADLFRECSMDVDELPEEVEKLLYPEPIPPALTVCPICLKIGRHFEQCCGQKL